MHKGMLGDHCHLVSSKMSKMYIALLTKVLRNVQKKKTNRDIDYILLV